MTSTQDPPSQASLKLLEDVFLGLPHSRALGLTIVEMKPGAVVMALDYRSELTGNPENGVLHGGAITSLMDSVGGAAAFTRVSAGSALATLDLRIDYLKPATPQRRLYGRAEVYKLTSNVAFVRGEAYHDQPEDPVAHCTATFMVGSVGFVAGGEAVD